MHVNDWRAGAGQSPRQGLRVTFEDIQVGGKGPRAVAVQPLDGGGRSRRDEGARTRAASPSPSPRRRGTARRAAAAPQAGAWIAFPLMAGYAFTLAWLAWRGQAAGWLLPAWVLLNLATFAAYWRDKQAARNGRRRIREDSLHLWSLAGGWGGAWLAQHALRHKSAKASFRAVYRATVLVHWVLASGLWWWSRAP